MAGTILTPTAIWSDFIYPEYFNVEVVSENTEDNLVFTWLYVNGRKVNGEDVRIYGVIVKDVQQGLRPAIVLADDLNFGRDINLAKDIAKHGYTVFCVDLGGKKEGEENFTKYPESISYANYEQVKDNIYHIEENAKKSCWYEWACVLRCCIKYLKTQSDVTKVGGFAIAEVATALWETAGTDSNLDCAIFALDAGWVAYRGIHKFEGKVEPQFTDSMYQYVAGVEPQAYAMHVKCPTLMLVATNSKEYDCDRAYDTISRINEELYSGVHYSVGFRRRLSGDAYNTAAAFAHNVLTRGDEKGQKLPSEPEISCRIQDGEIIVSVKVEDKDLKELAVYVSEGTVNPSLRCWHKITENQVTESGEYEFKYFPYPNSKIVVAFAQSEYKSGFSVGSMIVAKRFLPEEVKLGHKENVIYSSRTPNGQSVFGVAHSEHGEDKEKAIKIITSKLIKVKKGPMGISGVTCKTGLLTFKINAEKYKPLDSAILMFDVYGKEKATFTVKLIEDYFGAKTEYSYAVSVVGGEVWQNVKIERPKFKTAEGMGLKSYQKINAIEFSCDCEDYLINNALWV